MNRARRSARGVTLLEVLVSLAVLAMISLLVYGAFESLGRGKKAEAARIDRARQGRDALLRITRELSGAFLSMHRPANAAAATNLTAFVAKNGVPFDRVDFTAFAHRRIESGGKDSDQAEIGYFVVRDPDRADKMDLVRREQTPIDLEPTRGGVINVVAEDVERFELSYLDASNGQWLETWDSTQAVGQLNRLPFEIKVTLTLKATAGVAASTFTTKFMLPIQQPLVFGLPPEMRR